ncbi:uncharacterized protein FOMMEDRAFT_134275 [Fomitiporia mediterranea MF3/22]|uniref:uncharacterized protein n=1 Tax=Fomitiporia mediterranea (strain MF3/22) TaxID=694068 RepID=UPI00044086B6|nr:uncharacterized protein FOMMEDRAFT_134275 [Fomitiporia mediterranea MF3/22]EJD03156.1 hypothetical protein FOMMEDRAFT_134275 [Fomitiporia mediterranea MF3/22]
MDRNDKHIVTGHAGAHQNFLTIDAHPLHPTAAYSKALQVDRRALTLTTTCERARLAGLSEAGCTTSSPPNCWPLPPVPSSLRDAILLLSERCFASRSSGLPPRVYG